VRMAKKANENEGSTRAGRSGRPRKEINQAVFESLCEIQCTEQEIASVLRVSVDTLSRWCLRTFEQTFAEAYKKLSAEGKSSLRRAQFKMAQSNPAMAIWLGKQYLGQREPKFEVDVKATSAAREAFQSILAETGLPEDKARQIVAARFGVSEQELISSEVM
jgi:AraC-like DNA-binding protein